MNRILPILCLAILITKAMLSAAPELPANEAPIKDILALVQKSVETFWNQCGSVICVESVTQEKFGKHNKIEYKQKSTFDYLVLLNVEKDGLSVDESRMQQGKMGKAKNIPLLVAGGLPALILGFHPFYRESFHYELAGDEQADGHRLVKIQFKHIPGTRSTTALQLRGKDYPLDLQGVAWVDVDTGAIHKIVAGLSSPMIDLNFKSLEMEVCYAAHRFPSEEGIAWLPSTATIAIQTERQRWRNIHQYSNYKKFTVHTEDRVSR
jgi:hypothetical protein